MIQGRITLLSLIQGIKMNMVETGICIEDIDIVAKPRITTAIKLFKFEHHNNSFISVDAY